jgi:pimeloyl-ACP methyl ester carboxylesterase
VGRVLVEDAGMFDGFALQQIDVDEGVRLRVRVGGQGPPVVLLHGHPASSPSPSSPNGSSRPTPTAGTAPVRLERPGWARATTPTTSLYGDVLAVWRPWAADLRGAAISSGHHMAEEAPDELAAVLTDFLASAAGPSDNHPPTGARCHYADGRVVPPAVPSEPST